MSLAEELRLELERKKKIKEEEEKVRTSSPEYIREKNAEYFAEIKKSFQENSTGNRFLQVLKNAFEGRVYLEKLTNDELNFDIAKEQIVKFNNLVEKITKISLAKSPDFFEGRNLKNEIQDIYKDLKGFIEYIHPEGQSIRDVLKENNGKDNYKNFENFENWKKESAGILSSPRLLVQNLS